MCWYKFRTLDVLDFLGYLLQAGWLGAGGGSLVGMVGS
jgi:hypothetical protein